MKRESLETHMKKTMTFIAEQMELSAPQLAYIENQLLIAWEKGHAEGYVANQQLHIDLLTAMDAKLGEPRYVEREYRNRPGRRPPWSRK